MSSDMLGTIVRKLVTLSVETHGVVVDLLVKLEDPEWLAATKRFLRKENPWPEMSAAASQEPLWRRVEGCPNAIEVNFANSGTLPFTVAEPDWRWGQQTGWVRVELKGNNLYVKGKKVVFHFEPEQTKGRIPGHTLLDRFKVRDSAQHLHPNVLEACKEAGILPESWKVDDQGRTRYIFAWARGFRRSGGHLCILCLYWRGGRWDLDWLGYEFDGQRPAAVIGEESLAA